MAIARDRGVTEEWLPLAARGAVTQGVGSHFGSADSLRAQLDVTAFTVAAGNTLDVVIEDSLDGINWNVIGAFAQRTAVGREIINVTIPFGENLRVRSTVGGAPAATYGVTAYVQ